MSLLACSCVLLTSWHEVVYRMCEFELVITQRRGTEARVLHTGVLQKETGRVCLCVFNVFLDTQQRPVHLCTAIEL